MTAITLSWDNKPERKLWSAALLTAVNVHLSALEQGTPNDFVPGYNGLSDAKKQIYWAELVIALAKYESGWDPHNIFHEPPPLTEDSVGLLQLSYSDANNYVFPDHLSPAQKSLEDPVINIRCGLVILAHWLAHDHVVAKGSGGTSKGAARYWSVIRTGTSHHRQAIKDRVKSATGL